MLLLLTKSTLLPLNLLSIPLYLIVTLLEIKANRGPVAYGLSILGGVPKFREEIPSS